MPFFISIGRRYWLAMSAAGYVFLGAAVAAQQMPASTPGAMDGGTEIRAQLAPRKHTILSSEIAARIDRMNTDFGRHFKEGDVLVEFDCVIPRAEMARADAVVVQSVKTVAINKRLLNLKSVGQLELDVSEAELAKAKANLAIARATVSKCTIAAPFSGVTVEKKAQAFQYAAPGQPLLEILNDQALDVELIAPSRWLNWLQPGTRFKVRIDETEKTYPVRVTRLGGRVDPVSQSVKVIGEITEPAPDLMAGMSGRAIISRPPGAH
jgi:membrane fusion protein, multidrug efflux system